MTKIAQSDFLSVVQGRHSVKHFDCAHEISREEMENLLAVANCAPSAWNLQHWKFLAIAEREAKEKLMPIAYGQKQVVEASIVIAILGDLQAHRNAEAVYESAVQAGLMPEHVKSSLLAQIESAYAGGGAAYRRDEAMRNASLAAMQLMLAAKAAGLDSCPMGGYDSYQLINTFSIPSRYIPVMLIAIGKAIRPAHQSSRYLVNQKVVWNRFMPEE